MSLEGEEPRNPTILLKDSHDNVWADLGNKTRELGSKIRTGKGRTVLE
jgi:hypothetical protein